MKLKSHAHFNDQAHLIILISTQHPCKADVLLILLLVVNLLLSLFLSLLSCTSMETPCINEVLLSPCTTTATTLTTTSICLSTRFATIKMEMRQLLI